MAIMALVLLSALVAGALFVSTEELRAGRTDLADQRALATAELSLERAIASWDQRRNTALEVGASVVAVDDLPTTNERVVVTATRVQRLGVLITAFATAAGDGRGIPTRHTVAASMRLSGISIPAVAALTARGAVSVDGGVVDGRDVAEGGTARSLCDAIVRSDASGVAVPDTSLVCGLQCTGGPPAGVIGNPPVVAVPGLTSDLVRGRLGGDSVASLAARASIDLAGGTRTPSPATNGVECDRLNPLNWGDPDGGACADHYPVIHVRGSLVLAAGSVGQGVLLVEGSLRVEAGARFVGAAIVRDDIAVVGAGAEIVGAAFAADTDGVGASRVADGGSVRLASCAVQRAILGTSRLTRVPVRWWAELR